MDSVVNINVYRRIEHVLMERAADEPDDGSLRVDLRGRLKLAFHDSRITSDAGLLLYRELADDLGCTDLAGAALSECRRGKYTPHLPSKRFHHQTRNIVLYVGSWSASTTGRHL